MTDTLEENQKRYQEYRALAEQMLQASGGRLVLVVNNGRTTCESNPARAKKIVKTWKEEYGKI